MAMTKTETRRELQAVINELANWAGCIFWACPGPNRPVLDGATCRVCYAIKDLRRIKREM